MQDRTSTGDEPDLETDPESDTGPEEPELQPELEELPIRRSLLGRLITLAVIVTVALAVIAAGREFHNPPSRVPNPLSYPVASGLYGTSEPIMAELRTVESLLVRPGQPTIDLTRVDRVYEIELPRTLADRLFGKRVERATVFTARTGAGLELRVLALRDDRASPLFALETPSARRAPAAGVEGVYVGLPVAQGSESPFTGLIGTLGRLLDDADASGKTRLAAGDYTIFGPFGRGDAERLARRIEGNVVLDHLATVLNAAKADVSLAASVFSIRAAPARGVIKATYQPRQRLVQEPLGGPSETSSLAHELTHAYMSLVMPDSATVLRSAAAYFETAHPRLYGEVVDDLYQQLSSSGRAEETLAFSMGSIASGDTKTIASSHLLQNQGLTEVSEAILKTDVELLIRLGLLPECMDPTGAGHTDRELNFAYYDSIRSVCS